MRMRVGERQVAHLKEAEGGGRVWSVRDGTGSGDFGQVGSNDLGQEVRID